jgi:hypothetical protein
MLMNKTAALLRKRPPHYYRKRAGRAVGRLFVYALLTEFAFIFMLPLIVIVTTAPKGLSDLLNPVIYWLPTSIRFSNFAEALRLLDMPRTLLLSLFDSGVTTAAQALMCAVAGYALGRYRFPGRSLIYVLVALCIIVPPQTVIISQYAMYASFSLTNTLFPVMVPELFGHGLRGALFVVVLFGIYWKRASEKAACWSMLLTGVAAVAWKVVDIATGAYPISDSITETYAAVVVALAATVLFSVIWPKKQSELAK